MRKNAFYQAVPIRKPNRNLFDLSHEVKMSGKFGYLYPVLLQETLPGETWREEMIAQVRFAPMLAPIMHRIDVKTDYFFVPTRLVDDNWEEFITGGQDGLSAIVLPYITPAVLQAAGSGNKMIKGTLWDYFGLPVKASATVATSVEKILVHPFQAYLKIWNDFFRDPNLDDEIDLHTEIDGAWTSANFTDMGWLVRRGWERDYFTAALPWSQRGAEVLMPLAGTGVVEWPADLQWEKFAGGPPAPGAASFNIISNLTDSAAAGVRPVADTVTVELNSSDVFINDLRRALAIQTWLENNARGGGRYIEQIEAHFGERVPDYRLQRSEYIGGGRQPVQISQVLSTADTTNVPVGDMAGHGISVGKTNRFNYRCKEHGYIIGIMSVVPRTAYQQGIHRLWSRQSKFDYAFPELAHLGEQEVINKELYYGFLAADDAANADVFGYMPRYAEYKVMQDRVAGDFRDTLAFWHESRIFTARPALNSDFVTMLENSTSLEQTSRRIFAVQDGTDYLWIQLFHRLTVKRPLPYFGVPRLIG